MKEFSRSDLRKAVLRMKSEDEDNPEYDRALIELCVEVAGGGQEDFVDTALGAGYSMAYADRIWRRR